MGADIPHHSFIINNHPVYLKCFKKYSDVEDEWKKFEIITAKVPSCPGIIGYYGVKKL